MIFRFVSNIVCAVFLLSSCRSSVPATTPAAGAASELREGWLDDDTVQFTGYGRANPEHRFKVKIQTHSYHNAVLDAQNKALMLLKGITMSDYYRNTSDGIDRGLTPLPGGVITKKEYDAQDNCRVVYRLQRYGLKKSVGK